MGRHFNTLSMHEMFNFLKHFYIGIIMYTLALTFIKLALLFQYLRVLSADSKRRRICKWLIGLTSIWGFFYSIPACVPCYPVASTWDLSLPSRKCWGFA